MVKPSCWIDKVKPTASVETGTSRIQPRAYYQRGYTSTGERAY
ncbi:hypothetical protein OAO24_05480 [Methylophilaceae bacterium]|nr:hypothetical protein [Methylophilaceae bacterium]